MQGTLRWNTVIIFQSFDIYASKGRIIATSLKQGWSSDMLILTRRIGESMVIGDNIIVTVMGVKGNQIRIGIKAPKEIEVHREEVFNQIAQERSQNK